jgi:threonine/homoserine/homoserine lactone efflux protein
MAASSMAAFWVASSLLIMVPGADWAYTIVPACGATRRFRRSAASCSAMAR